LVETFSEFKEFKNIDRAMMMRILEDVFRHMLIKKYGTDENIDVVVNIDKGDFEIWRTREIVEDGMSEDDNLEIEYSEAIKLEPDFEVGEEVYEPIGMAAFGRRDILAIRQNLIAKIQEFEKDNVFKKYRDKIGEIITGEVYQIWRKELLVLDDEGIELSLPKSEQIPSDFYHKGDTIRAVVSKVDLRNGYDGLITIKKIVRVPGERAKIAVESYDDRIDPVGACVGMKGSRIHGIVRELKNENIDVINFTSNPQLFIQRALSPAKISSIQINEDEKRADVYMKPDQVSLAIGKGGFNIKLAGKLTGYEIDVYRDAEGDNEDVDLGEFTDEIDQWIIATLKNIGCDTAKSVLEIPVKELVHRTDLEEETIQEVVKILKAEFE